MNIDKTKYKRRSKPYSISTKEMKLLENMRIMTEGGDSDGYQIHLTKSQLKSVFKVIAKALFRDHVFEFYLREDGDYGWRRRTPNGEIISASTEGYKNRKDCYDNAVSNGYGGELPKLKKSK